MEKGLSNSNVKFLNKTKANVGGVMLESLLIFELRTFWEDSQNETTSIHEVEM